MCDKDMNVRKWISAWKTDKKKRSLIVQYQQQNSSVLLILPLQQNSQLRTESLHFARAKRAHLDTSGMSSAKPVALLTMYWFLVVEG
jgi:hypothetical protein